MEQTFDNEEETLFEHHRIEVDKGQALLRIDRFLTDRLPNASRNKIQLAIDSDFVLVNGKPTKANYKIRPSDVITISLPEPPRDTDVKPENIPLNIVYEDDYLLVVNKPAGMVVHPAFNNWSGTLVNALTHHFQNLPTMKGNDGRPGLVHRIDKDTSGLLVIAKTDAAMVHLAKQFYVHSIERTYYALVWGEPKESRGTIDAPLGRSLKDRRVTIVYTPESGLVGGKEAVTHYEVLKNIRYVSLLKCNLETGRTHQIRVHLKHLGHPIFNDETYGGNIVLKGNMFSKYKSFVENCFQVIPRQALHAKTLGFIHPITKEKMQFDSDLPADFQAALEKWEHYVNYN
ncbi:MAG: RluA family pseudouridine synthase [Cytophagales bacterium]|nr:MAG: RluA family pseudouridine synthase [Cytophagales bacterium]